MIKNCTCPHFTRCAKKRTGNWRRGFPWFFNGDKRGLRSECLIKPSKELPFSQECLTVCGLGLCSQCVFMSVSLGTDTLTARMSSEKPLIRPLCNLQDTLMTERGEEGWVQPVSASRQVTIFLNVVFRSLPSK